MATTFHFQKGVSPEINIEDYFAIRITSVRGLNPPQPKEIFTRDWASEDGVDYFLATSRKIKSSEVIMTVLFKDSAAYLGMQVKAMDKYDEFCEYIKTNGLLQYRDTLQNRQVNIIYNANKPEWYQFIGKGQILAEITFINPSGVVTKVDPINTYGQKPEITSSLTATGTVPDPFTYTITADYDPLTFEAFNLPLGLTLDSNTGIISGSPLVSGVFNCFISASNGYGNDLELFVLTIQSA